MAPNSINRRSAQRGHGDSDQPRPPRQTRRSKFFNVFRARNGTENAFLWQDNISLSLSPSALDWAMHTHSLFSLSLLSPKLTSVLALTRDTHSSTINTLLSHTQPVWPYSLAERGLIDRVLVRLPGYSVYIAG